MRESFLKLFLKKTFSFLNPRTCFLTFPHSESDYSCKSGKINSSSGGK